MQMICGEHASTWSGMGRLAWISCASRAMELAEGNLQAQKTIPSVAEAMDCSLHVDEQAEAGRGGARRACTQARRTEGAIRVA